MKASIGDLHFGVKGGDKHFLAWQVAYMKRKLQAMADKGVTKLYQLGDAFDNRKQTQTIVQEAMLEVIQFAESLDISIVFIVGNHNTFYTDTNESHNLSVFALCPNVTIVQEHEEIDGILFLGWIHKNNKDEIMQAVEASTAKTCMMHAEFNGFDMYAGIKAKGGMSIAPFRKFNQVLTGHYHTISEDGNVKYIGSPYALTWMDFVDGTNRGWFLHDATTDTWNLQANEDHETLFKTHTYNPDHAYSEFDFVPFANSVVKFFVKEVKDEKHYQNFIRLVNATSYIDRRVIDERELKKVDAATVDVSKMAVEPLKVIVQDITEAATLNALDVELGVNLISDLYTRASSGV